MTELPAIVAREVVLLQEYFDLLGEEQDILRRGEALALGDICTRKTTLVEQLNAAERMRIDAVALREGETIHSAMARWSAEHPDSPEVAAQWSGILDLARQARQRHDQNGQLTRLLLQQTSELLASLTRQAPTQTLYGSNGQAWQDSGRRIIDSA